MIQVECIVYGKHNGEIMVRNSPFNKGFVVMSCEDGDEYKGEDIIAAVMNCMNCNYEEN